MKLIGGITDNPKQQMTINLADGSNITLYLEYRPSQIGWFFDLTSDNFTWTGNRIVQSPNLLRHFKSILGYGIACITANNLEPYTSTAFIDGTASLYLLDATDIADIEAAVYPGL